jgi:hypothetical protein
MIASGVLTTYQVKRKREAAAGAEPPRKPDAPARPGDYRAPVPASETDADGWPVSDEPWNSRTTT